MGGYVALKYAQNNPTTFSKIITYGTKFDWTPESALKETGKLIPEKVEEKVPQFAAFLAKIHSSNDWKNVMLKTASMMIELGNTSALTLTDLKSIATPVVIGIGTNDFMVSVSESEFAASHIPNAELIQLEGFVHPLEQNNPTELVKQLIVQQRHYS